MKYPHKARKVAGILVPLAGLRSSRSIGCGEFSDLIALGEWCTGQGLQLIQLLPVNDTGSQSSPYSALSANALHPIYLRLESLPEIESLDTRLRKAILAELANLRDVHETAPRFDYEGVLAGKMSILRKIYDAVGSGSSDEITAFIRTNPWAKGYAVFRALKDLNGQLPWMEWESHRETDKAGVDRLWKRRDLQESTRFYVWVQIRLAEQFSAAARELDRLGVALKGDIPILMNQDSADAWFDRDIFRQELRAGAPPDMFSELGQNWGFPIYNWKRLEERDYDWWRNRLRGAARYYHAYRIDHVLGFFRIWAVPAGNYSGIPGFFWPQHGITTDDLHDLGFDDGRITWLREPHISGDILRQHLGTESLPALLGTILRQLGGEDLYLFSDTVTGERYLADLDLPEEEREWLIGQYRNRALLSLPDGSYATTWTFRECDRYQGLSDREKERFEALVARTGTASNELWAEHGRQVLAVLKESTEMLPCAEDLGVVPEAVPRVLTGLGILGLKIPRWTHYWDQPGQPLIPFTEYPEASVCAPSVHDTSTMRGWWQLEEGRQELWEATGMEGPAPELFDPETARTVYRAILEAPSRIVVFALQDLLVLAPEIIHENPEQERVNIPGSYNDFNWTWRMPVSLEELQQNAALQGEITALLHDAGRTRSK